MRGKTKIPYPNGRIIDQYRDRLFFSIQTRRMVGIVHKNLQNYCQYDSAHSVAMHVQKLRQLCVNKKGIRGCLLFNY
ncbi:hypothetical protein FC063_02780 [Vibrio tasmaniensis]|uniref:Mobile element protein n=1 Tax=Vibrio tasmaniensis TaxID=212663 RepID=A0AB38NW11_9VIBR|nr:hypothetical protein FC057_04985 [Vibrio tasmaniensis]TKG43076.1 hypothetical protein FC063_02780 [Vibrio tasmaniensis]TKG44201.1 hypothetical protein FC060_18225 [Vibrio tasmaniensis]TKG52953.1 hypothetical protein FC061_09410 [Vibrio tasmaniensis]TKG54772.1 hypothetical protein FC070_03325 [Vibrio tasmaniensis]